MVRKSPRTLLSAVRHAFPSLEDPEQAIGEGKISVDGSVNRNAQSAVGAGSQISLAQPSILRGEAKLRAALERFEVPVEGRVALDVGAAAGGFTKVLLERGARLVYAVDAGHGQLLGSLRQDPRVRNLEATNLGTLDKKLVPDPIELFTLDLSYLSLADAAPQLERVGISDHADLVALVKPMFELHLSRPPEDAASQQRALELAREGIAKAGWEVVSWMDSPVTGARGAVEFLVHATRGG
ncbi:MAG TPA: TlyA family rRNA (cytidine-2'-O)-methyltransferase [Chloroflexi bacterium]|jgi:23S rRNA (cytidine1920-2'-O)/16S rRNA (cytidine1409-2'-O)-methyltransferase|nr:TlyA family rRNA (cytidine-2'-O)-methyltransferase [Chloroflexota bacterium]